MTDYGSFPLTGVAGLPNVTVAFPGEHWSNRKAYTAITPGAAVMPTSSGGALYVAIAGSADSGSKRIGIALRQVSIPDINSGTYYAGSHNLGPTEIMNLEIAAQDYVHVWMTGAFHLTLMVPAVYAPGDLIGWDPAGLRPAGKSGTGAWKKVTTEAGAFAEVMEVREYNALHEGIVTVRSLRSQF